MLLSTSALAATAALAVTTVYVSSSAGVDGPEDSAVGQTTYRVAFTSIAVSLASARLVCWFVWAVSPAMLWTWQLFGFLLYIKVLLTSLHSPVLSPCVNGRNENHVLQCSLAVCATSYATCHSTKVPAATPNTLNQSQEQATVACEVKGPRGKKDLTWWMGVLR